MTVHLSIVLLAPLAFALVGSLLPGRSAAAAGFVGTLVSAFFAIAMLFGFDPSQPGLQYVTDDAWITTLGIRYKLGVDGLSLWLVALTTVLFAASALWILVRPVPRERSFVCLMALAELGVLGAFTGQDLALFVGCYDLMLIPFLFLMLGWGGPRRRPAAIKLIVYTLVGSLLMLAAAVATAVLSADQSGGSLSFVLSDLGRVTLAPGTQRLIFVGFALAFLIKMPAFLVQGWMPDTYSQMPLPALAVFSAVLSKVAAYGFLRIVLPLYPDASVDFHLILEILAVAGILYGSAMAFTQTSLRLILGYSSVAQLSFITLGIFSLQPQGAQGAILQSVTHGLVVAPLFFVIALICDRAEGSEDLRHLGGMAVRGPVMATLFLVLAFATLAIPGSANFAGEFYILLGAFKSSIALASIAFVGVVMASVYMLRAYIRTMHNRVGAEVHSHDISLRDRLVLVPLVAAVLAFAVYPQGALSAGEQALSGKSSALAAVDRGARAGSTEAQVSP